MLAKLKGSKTLILLVIANLPSAFEALGRIVSGVGNEDLATAIVKAGAGLVAVLTVISRLLPADEPAKALDDKSKNPAVK